MKTQVTFDALLSWFNGTLTIPCVPKPSRGFTMCDSSPENKSLSIVESTWKLVQKTNHYPQKGESWKRPSFEGGFLLFKRLRPHLSRWAFPHLPILPVLRRFQEPPAWRAEGQCHASLPCLHQIMIIINIIMNIMHVIVLLVVIIIIIIVVVVVAVVVAVVVGSGAE